MPWATFQHTAARRRLAEHPFVLPLPRPFQHTAARRRLEPPIPRNGLLASVSTHSRPKAAGVRKKPTRPNLICFNTQPPEGGWFSDFFQRCTLACFNTQPPEGGWTDDPKPGDIAMCQVSTHSRLKAAGPKHGGGMQYRNVSTHSRLKAAGTELPSKKTKTDCFNTQPPEGGWSLAPSIMTKWVKFQHTAA